MKRKLLSSLLLAFAVSTAMAQNTAYGTNAGNAGGNNSSFGYSAGDVITGSDNTFIGYQSGLMTTSASSNAFLGAFSGGLNTTGYSNTFIGYSTGYNNTTGFQNTILGRSAGFVLSTGSSNSFIGVTSGRLNTSGSYNNAFGFESLFSNVTGTNNTALGHTAGHNALGSYNVFLGNAAGYFETGSNKLYIDNSSGASPLIYGDFSSDIVGINGSLGVGISAPSDNFHVIGTARFQSLTRLDTLSRVMVTNTSGKVYWRKASTLADNLGNHLATQSITASANNSYDIGTSAANFKDIYFGGKLYTGSYPYWKTTGVGTVLASIYIGENSGVSSTGYSNTALGYYALNANTTGLYNVAIGSEALKTNTTGPTNVAVGTKALKFNTDGVANVAVGTSALENNTTADGNVGVGLSALAGTTTGNGNVAVGSAAMMANTTGELNTAVGDYAAATAGNFTNSTAIGHNSTYTASNQVRIGDANVTSIGGQVSWTTISDGRFKKSVKQDVAGLDFILKLKPVSYVVDANAVDNFLGVPQEARAKQRAEAQRQTGFIAQEVEAVVKKSNYAFYGVDAPKSDKDHYGIRYSEFVMPLVKAVQEMDVKVNSLQDVVAAQKELIDKQQLMLTAMLDRMSAVTNEPATQGSTLYQNHPNPFRNGETEITMDIAASATEAVINVYDMNGKTIDNVTVTARGKGVSVKAGSGKLTPGIYIYSLLVDGRLVGVNKMVMTD